MDKNKNKRIKNPRNLYYDSEEDIHEIRQCRLENRLFELKRQCHRRLEASLSLFAARRFGLPDDGLEEAAQLPNNEKKTTKTKKKRSLWKRFKDLFKIETKPKSTPQPPLPYVPEDPTLPLKYREVRKKRSKTLSRLNNQMISAVKSITTNLPFYREVYEKRQNRMMRKMGSAYVKSTAYLNEKNLYLDYASSSGNISTDYSTDEFSNLSVSEKASNEHLNVNHKKLLTSASSGIISVFKESFQLEIEQEINSNKDDAELLEFLDVKPKVEKENSTFEKNMLDEDINSSIIAESKRFCKEQQETEYDRQISIVYKRRGRKVKISKTTVDASAEEEEEEAEA